MTVAQKPKASDKQGICKKLVPFLKKRYKDKPLLTDSSVVETLIYAACLENASMKQANAAFTRLHDQFYDLNEIRVSSISELTDAFLDTPQPDWRALAVRSILAYVFEKTYSFDFESLRRKTLELATRQLSRIKHISPFVRNYTLQLILGSHTVPLDDSMRRACIWLGLVDPSEDVEQASESMKAVLRKSDAPAFCHLLHCVATDPRLQPTFDAAEQNVPEHGYDLYTAPQRLSELAAEADAQARKKKSTARKTGPEKRSGSKKSATGRAARSTSPARKKKKATRKK